MHVNKCIVNCDMHVNKCIENFIIYYHNRVVSLLTQSVLAR